MDDQQIRERLAKIKALFTGATTAGERSAAQAAMDRLQQRLGPTTTAAPEQEFRFALANPWSLRLFLALCRSKGMRPYRYPRMRRTSVCVRLTRHVLDQELWPEFTEMNAVLGQYLTEVADRVIADSIDSDRSDADVVAGLPGPSAGSEISG